MFDDEEDSSYLGLAQVSLLPLAQGKPLSGTFQLKQVCMYYICTRLINETRLLFEYY